MTLASAYTMHAPPGVTFSSWPALPAPPCAGMQVTPTAITVPAGVQLNPASSCHVGATVTTSGEGNFVLDSPTVTTAILQGPTVTFGGGTYSFNGGGGYYLSSGSNPSVDAGSVTSMPLQVTVGSAAIWSDTYVFDFVGTSQSFTVPIGNAATPNLLTRSAGTLTVNGIAGTPPYSATAPNQPTIGTAFQPIADKLFAPVAIPAGSTVLGKALHP